MLTLVAMIIGGALVVLGVVAATIAVGLRQQWAWARRMVRRFARAFVNPRMLRTAGAPGAYASVIYHVGRKTGRAYRTPVVAVSTGDGFAVALPYGTTSNWVKNVLASGSATLVHDGTAYFVDRPRIVPLALLAYRFSPKDQRSHERFKLEQCLVLRCAANPGAQETGDSTLRTHVEPEAAVG